MTLLAPRSSSLGAGSAQATGRLTRLTHRRCRLGPMAPAGAGGQKWSYGCVSPECWALCGLLESWGLMEPLNSHGRDVTPPSQRMKRRFGGQGSGQGSPQAGHDWGYLTAVPLLGAG